MVASRIPESIDEFEERFFLTPTEELDAEEFEYDIVEVEVEQPEDGCSPLGD